MLQIFLSLFLLISNISYTIEEPLQQDEEAGISLVDCINTAVPKVHGSVSVISGALVESQIPLTDSASVDPYQLGYGYASSSIDEGTLADGWEFFHPTEIEIIDPNFASGRVKKDKTLGQVRLTSREPGGGMVLFYGDKHGKHFKPYFKGTGYTHVASIQKPTPVTVHTADIIWDQDHKKVKMTLKNGCTRVYEQYDKERFYTSSEGYEWYDKKMYRIKEMSLPSGNRRLFSYKHDELVSIETVGPNNVRIGEILFDTHSSSKLVVTMSNGQKVFFHYKTLHDRKKAKVVNKIQIEGGKSFSFSYSEKSSKHIRRIDEKEASDGRRMKASFLSGTETKSTDSKTKKFLENRVFKLFSTRMPGETHTKQTHTFVYTKKHDDIEQAQVTESDGCSMIYQWHSESKRMRWVHCKDRDGKKLSSERFVFESENENQGRLIRRVRFDEHKNPVLIKEWFFDRDGNVIKESLRGYFFSISSINNPLVINPDDFSWKSGGDHLVWKASYDSFGRKISEKSPDGYETEYTYLRDDGTHHIKKKLSINPNGEIFQRLFYLYGTGIFSNLVISEIKDDGSGRSIENMSSVSRRIIRKFHLKPRAPYFGAISSQEEYIWTAQGGEKLLSKVKYLRDTRSGLTLEEIYSNALGQEIIRVRHRYDEFHRLISTRLPDGSFIKKTYEAATGRVHSESTQLKHEVYSYDHEDRVIGIETTYPDGSKTKSSKYYNRMGREIVTIDERGAERSIQHDIVGRKIKEKDALIIVNGRAVRPETHIQYSGMKVVTTLPDGQSTTEILSSDGNSLQLTLSNNLSRSIRYDKLGREVEKIDFNGIITKSFYDDYGNMIRQEEIVDGVSQELFHKTFYRSTLVQESTLGTITQFFYDSYGRKREERTTDRITGKIEVKKWLYDAQHRVRRVIDESLGTYQVTTYDSMNRITKVSQYSLLDNTLLSKVIKTFDSFGRLSSEAALTSFSNVWATTSYQYGAYGKCVVETDAQGLQKKMFYILQAHGERGLPFFVSRVTSPDGTTLEEWKNHQDKTVVSKRLDPFHRVIQERLIHYDIMGRMVKVIDIPIDPESSKPCSPPSITEFAYDAFGNCVLERRGAESDSIRTTQYRYDSLSRKIEEIKPSGVKLFSSYDRKGRKISYKSSDYTVDYQFQYNALNQVEATTDYIHGEHLFRKHSGKGKILQESFSDGTINTFSYDSSDRIEEISSNRFEPIRYTYSDGSLSSVSYKNNIASYSNRSPIGLAQTISLSSDGVTTDIYKTHDFLGRSNRLEAITQNRSHFLEERLSFNIQGTLETRKMTLSHILEPRHEFYSYDRLQQLIYDGHDSYQFDSLNRITSLRGKAQSFSTLHEQISASRRYDIDGRIIEDNGTRYTYDALDRLVSVENENVSYHYRYDAFHRRLFRSTKSPHASPQEERFLYHNENEIGSYNRSNNSLISLRILGEGLGAEIGATLFIELQGTECYHTISDLSGHIRALINPTTNSIDEWFDYSGYRTIGSSNTKLSPWSFSSKRHEDYTSLIFFGRRYYDQSSASWTTLDPMGFSCGPNLYAYVSNNPFTLFDSYGLFGDREYVQFNDRAHIHDRNTTSAFEQWHHGIPSNNHNSSSNDLCSNVTVSGSSSSETIVSQNVAFQSDVNYPSGTYVVFRDPNTTTGEFIEKNKNNTNKLKVIIYGNGINTSMYTCILRARAMFDMISDLKMVIIQYNSTEGVMKDFYECSQQALNVSTEVVEVLYNNLVSLLQTFQADNVTFEADMHLHSQGALIGQRILEYHNECIESHINKIFTYGGAYLIKGATNFWAVPDIVPLLNPFSFARQLLHGCEDVTLAPFHLQSPLGAHDFDGPAYQECFRRATAD